MAIYEITDVALLPERHDALLGFELDAPAAGDKRNTYTLHAIGWVVGRHSRAISVEVLYNDRLLRVVPVRGPRSDVAEALGVPPDTECVFHALVGLVGLKLEATISFTVVLADGSRHPAGSITVRREPLRTDYEPRLRPLMVTTLGRSGSTWLMQILAAHPEVVVFRRFPYESTPAKYWLHMLRVLTEPGNLVQSAHPDTFHNDLWWVGNNPYHDDRVYEQAPLEGWFAHDYVERMASFCQRSIEDWYMTLARTQVQPAPVYFAEKHMWPNYIPVLTWEMYPQAKEIFLVRDFRDMARSILSFDERRGFAGFGRPEGATDADYLRGELRKMAHDLSRSWQTRGERGHLVRYEDLVHDPVGSLTALLGYLGVDNGEPTVREVLEKGSEEILRLPGASYEPSEVRAHRTLADAKATIGRWRREGSEELRAIYDEVFAEPLAVFGYE